MHEWATECSSESKSGLALKGITFPLAISYKRVPRSMGNNDFEDSNYSHVLTLGLQAPKIPVHIWLSSSSSCLEDDKSADRRHRCQ